MGVNPFRLQGAPLPFFIHVVYESSLMNRKKEFISVKPTALLHAQHFDTRLWEVNSLRLQRSAPPPPFYTRSLWKFTNESEKRVYFGKTNQPPYCMRIVLIRRRVTRSRGAKTLLSSSPRFTKVLQSVDPRIFNVPHDFQISQKSIYSKKVKSDQQSWLELMCCACHQLTGQV